MLNSQKLPKCATNFRRLVLGCIEAKFCQIFDRILYTRRGRGPRGCSSSRTFFTGRSSRSGMSRPSVFTRCSRPPRMRSRVSEKGRDLRRGSERMKPGVGIVTCNIPCTLNFGGLVLGCIEADCLPSKRKQSLSTCPRKIYPLLQRLRSKSHVYELLHRSKSYVYFFNAKNIFLTNAWPIYSEGCQRS